MSYSASTELYFGASASDNAAEFLQYVNFSQSDGSPPDHAVTASDLLMAAYDPSKITPVGRNGE